MHVLRVRCSSGPANDFDVFLLFPENRLSQTLSSLFSVRDVSLAEFFLFLPDRRQLTAPPLLVPAPEPLRGLQPLDPKLTLSLGLSRCWESDSETERILSVPFLKLMGKSLNHLAIAPSAPKLERERAPLQHLQAPYTPLRTEWFFLFLLRTRVRWPSLNKVDRSGKLLDPWQCR